MRLTQRIMTGAVAALALVAAPGIAQAHIDNANTMSAFDAASRSYSGTYPVTISQSQRSNGTGCLTLKGFGTSGSASLVFESQKYTYGSFIVMNHLLVVTITEPLYGQNGALMFIVPVKRSHIGEGVFENIEGGSNFDFGTAMFGAKNGC